ncbi:hypothetical protein Mapa_011952 [Marchantia paleacea]|nr:hypothetical protein Mapa_011952 [Marchantia paleacea]
MKKYDRKKVKLLLFRLRTPVPQAADTVRFTIPVEQSYNTAVVLPFFHFCAMKRIHSVKLKVLKLRQLTENG